MRGFGSGGGGVLGEVSVGIMGCARKILKISNAKVGAERKRV